MKATRLLKETSLNSTQTSIKVPKTNKPKLMKDVNQKNTEYCKSNEKSEMGIEKQILLLKSRQRRTYSETTKPQTEFKAKLVNQKAKYESKVSYTDKNGNKFKGIYQNGIRVSGKMTYFQAKCQYEGSFFGLKFQGHGKLTFFDGRTIEGEWQDHILVGNALINYPNGDVYYGKVNQKLYKHGKGYLFLKNSDKYIGDFMNGSITGFGIFYKADKILEGKWIKGRLVKQINSSRSSDSTGVFAHVRQKIDNKDHNRPSAPQSAELEPYQEDLFKFESFSRTIEQSSMKNSARNSIASLTSLMRLTQDNIKSP